MNLHEKIAKIRCEVGIEKTGRNNFGKYDYFELSNIYQQCKEKMLEIGLSSVINSNADVYIVEGELKIITTWYLDVYDTEKPEDYVRYSMITLMNEGKGMAEPQNAGATRTYMEKYLYGSFLMIDDNALDPDATNDHGKSSMKTTISTTAKTASTRDELIAKFDSLSEDKKNELIAKYEKENGKRVSSGKFMRTDFLKGELII